MSYKGLKQKLSRADSYDSYFWIPALSLEEFNLLSEIVEDHKYITINRITPKQLIERLDAHEKQTTLQALQGKPVRSD